MVTVITCCEGTLLWLALLAGKPIVTTLYNKIGQFFYVIASALSSTFLNTKVLSSLASQQLSTQIAN